MKLQIKLETFLLVLGVIALTVIGLRAFLEFIPREGDAFVAWWPYVKGWDEHGLSYVLQHTPSGGKYPAYPLIIRVIMHLGNIQYLEALQWTRVFSLLLSVVGLFLLLSQLGLTWIKAWGATTFVHLCDVYRSTVTLNVQDCLKPGFFTLSVYFLLRLLQENESDLKARHRLFNTVGFAVSAIFLGMVRSVDLIPLLFFMLALCLQKDQWINSFYATIRNWKKSTTRKVVLSFTPVALFSFALHAYGKMVIGNWHFSGGEKPQIWAQFYLQHLKQDFSNDRSVINFLTSAVIWPSVRIINHLYYFVRDFVFQEDSLRMQGTYRWVQDFELMGGFASKVVGLCLVLLLVVSLVFKFSKERRFKAPLQPFLWGGIGGWAFWTFGLNHYEPRYWAIVYICWLIYLGIPLLQRHWALQGLAIGNTALLLLMLYNLPPVLDNAYARKINLAGWKAGAASLCNQSSKVVAIPKEYYLYSAYRYLAEQACPNLDVYFLNPDLNGESVSRWDGVKEVRHPMDKNVVVFTKKDLGDWDK